MTTTNKVFIGIFGESTSLSNFLIYSGYLSVVNGKITQKGSIEEFELLEKSGTFSNYEVFKLSQDQCVIPGFVDCHTHAPQFPNIGLGLDRPLLEWLAKYTFPLEKKYKNTEFASRIYDQVVQRLLKNGTTTACYFGSLHLEGTLELVKAAIKYNQRALVGKVSMNKENDAGYYNDTDKELKDVETFVQSVIALQNELVEPVVTPRFAVSCDKKLMDGLSKLANKYNCRIQSHISENLQEIEYVLETHENCKCYGDIYDRSGILNNRCIMAHAVHLTDDELTLLPSRGVSVAHCPASNTRLKSGLCDVRRLLNANITVGLGTDATLYYVPCLVWCDFATLFYGNYLTYVYMSHCSMEFEIDLMSYIEDVSGGDNATILDALRRSMDVSMCLELQGNPDLALNWKEAFYLSTLGGAKALSLDHKIGNFDLGKDFDALLIDVYNEGGPIDKYEGALESTNEEYAQELLQKFIFLGDDRNIVQVYVKGVKVKDIL